MVKWLNTEVCKTSIQRFESARRLHFLTASEHLRGDVVDVVDTIKRRFAQAGPSARVLLLKGGGFTAELTAEGILVHNLGTQPLLPWVVFEEAVALLVRNGGRADRGQAVCEWS